MAWMLAEQVLAVVLSLHTLRRGRVGRGCSWPAHRLPFRTARLHMHPLAPRRCCSLYDFDVLVWACAPALNICPVCHRRLDRGGVHEPGQRFHGCLVPVGRAARVDFKARNLLLLDALWMQGGRRRVGVAHACVCDCALVVHV